MFAEMKDRRGGVNPFPAHNTIQRVHGLGGPKRNFISEWDSAWPEEEPEEEGPKKKKIKKKEPEWKWYQHHKYEMAAIGKEKMDKVDNCVENQKSESEGMMSPAISLSYFTRPNTTAQNQVHENLPRDAKS